MHERSLQQCWLHVNDSCLDTENQYFLILPFIYQKQMIEQYTVTYTLL